MKASWKFLAFAGGLALAATAGAACTVTSGSGDDDAGDLFGDAGSGSDTSTAKDTGTTPDTGPTGCTSLTEVDPDGGSFSITFDQDGGSACDNCLEQNCCNEFNGCFEDSSGECQGLNGCLEACVEAPDAGGCNQDCQELYSAAATTDAFNGFTGCYGAHCSSACPQ